MPLRDHLGGAPNGHRPRARVRPRRLGGMLWKEGWNNRSTAAASHSTNCRFLGSSSSARRLPERVCPSMPPKAGIGSRMVCLGIKPVTGVEELQEGREEVWLREQRSRRLFFPARASVCNPIFCSGAPRARPRNGLPPTIWEYLKGQGWDTPAQPILVARPGKPKGTDWSLTVRVRGEERQNRQEPVT